MVSLLMYLIFVYVGVGLVLHALAHFQFLWVSVPSHMIALVTTKKNDGSDAVDLTKGGGTVVKVVHSVHGRKMDYSHHDQMNWRLVPGREKRDLLYRLFGVSWIGPFRYLMKVKVRSFQHGRKDKETTYHTEPKDKSTKFFFFSGNHVVSVQNADTAGTFELDLEFNTLFMNEYPVRAMLKVADSLAAASITAAERVNQITGMHEPETYLGNKYDRTKPPINTEAAKRALALEVQNLSPRLLAELGLSFNDVSLFSVDADEGSKPLLRLGAERARINAARIQDADAELKVRLKEVEGDKKELDDVILPAAREPGAVALATAKELARAYRDNETVTTFAPSVGGNGNPLGLILDPGRGSTSPKGSGPSTT